MFVSTNAEEPSLVDSVKHYQTYLDSGDILRDTIVIITFFKNNSHVRKAM